ncbi:peptidase S41 family protein [Aspergillus ruber CBS 135680]|uniref:Uncharacterized protein n=1 Tax=Aspergillus ruber (strain CBS 135680) TaxID=1388766 RepID=A0A017S6L8_ASPRC|nr:uncharacterized protein EURHEDRAFT_517827 [Aspergillus ruber CBS 135680]EYE92269.1 hypothetical protein EURHEDRAFT_517827 [Aspergillus ruber CBS 135680]
MYLLGSILASAVLVAAQTSTLIPTSSTPSAVPSSSSSAEACAKIAKFTGDTNNIPAKIAHDCLTSVPVAVEEDEALINQLKLMWEWNSETGWLKNTPETWDRGSLDLISELDKIKGNLSNYDSEYDVHLAIQKLSIDTGNYHFLFGSDILSIFLFWREVAMTTISDDGLKVPNTYVAGDIIAQHADDGVSISPITKVNGQDVQEYLEKIADWEQYTNLDARYNNLLFREAKPGSLVSPAQVFYGVYDDAATTVTFKNGTTRRYNNIATVSGVAENIDWSEVTDGKSLFKILSKLKTAADEPDTSSAAQKAARHLSRRTLIPRDNTNYPEPVVNHSDAMMAGYFMDTVNDVAVLQISSFDTSSVDNSTESSREFQRLVKEFLEQCQDKDKKKLILDLRENQGGDVDLLLDTFMQLFPAEMPFSAQRYRAQDGYKRVGDALNEIKKNDTAQEEFDSNWSEDILTTHWDYEDYVDVNGDSIPDWDTWLGPFTYNEDNFTLTSRYNMSNSNKNSVLGEGFKFENPSSGPPIFEPENMVMLMDGLCGSSCASFHEELKNVAGVKSVVVGGRAKEGPMQALGGTKGGTILSFSEMSQTIAGMINATEALGIEGFETPELKALANPEVLLRRAGVDGQIQIQDQVRKGDSSESTLQYTYEDADCRMFWTTKTLFEPQALWAAAWAAHTDENKCVKGSTKQPSSISGGFKPFGAGGLKGSMEQDDTATSTGGLTRKFSLVACAATTLLSFLL